MKTLTRLNEDFKISKNTKIKNRSNVVFVRGYNYEELDDLKLAYRSSYGLITLPYHDESERQHSYLVNKETYFRFAGISVFADENIKKHMWNRPDDIVWIFKNEGIDITFEFGSHISTYKINNKNYKLVITPVYIDKNKILDMAHRSVLSLNYGDDETTYNVVIKDFIKKGFLTP